MPGRPLPVVAAAAHLAAAIAVAVAAPAHGAETELATLAADTPIAAYAGRVVFSEQRADGLWHLRQWAAGTVRDVAVPAQRRPFDVDAGPDAAGDPVAVYSRCAGDPSERVLFSPLPDLSRSTGCAIHEMPLNGGTEQRRAPHGSEVLPSIWRGAVALVRHLPRERVGRVIVRPAGGVAFQVPGLTTAPCPTGWCIGPVAPRATAEQLDLGARRLALVWRYQGGQVVGAGPGWEASSAALLPGARPVLGGSGHASGACGASRSSGVAATVTGFSLLQIRADCENLTIVLRRISGDRRAEAVAADDVRAVAWDGATPYVLRAVRGSGSVRLMRLDPPRFVPRRQRAWAVTGFDPAERVARRTYRVGGGRRIVDARTELHGAARIRVPRARNHLNRDGSPSQRFSFEQNGCVARTSISLRADATRATPSDIVRRATGSAIADVARGSRPGGRFAVVELAARGSRRILHGIASVRIAPRRLVDVRTFTELRGRCTDGIVLADAVPRALTVVVRTAATRGLRLEPVASVAHRP